MPRLPFNSEPLITSLRKIEFLLARRPALFMMLTVSFILFLLINIASLNQNDFMYGVAPAVRAQHGNLYADVPFVQAPLSIMLNLLLTKVIGDVNIFF